MRKGVYLGQVSSPPQAGTQDHDGIKREESSQKQHTKNNGVQESLASDLDETRKEVCLLAILTKTMVKARPVQAPACAKLVNGPMPTEP